MTDKELLLAISDTISAQIEPLKKDITKIQTDITKIQADIVRMQADIVQMQTVIVQMQNEMTEMKTDTKDIKLHLENITDKNICLLAENHSTLIDKLNSAVKVADKKYIEEIKVNILTEKVEKLEREIEYLKTRIA